MPCSIAVLCLTLTQKMNVRPRSGAANLQCTCNSMAECEVSILIMGVRFSSSANFQCQGRALVEYRSVSESACVHQAECGLDVMFAFQVDGNGGKSP